MCYYKLRIHEGCGHGTVDDNPIRNAPPCPLLNDELFHKPSLASPIGMTFGNDTEILRPAPSLSSTIAYSASSPESSTRAQTDGSIAETTSTYSPSQTPASTPPLPPEPSAECNQVLMHPLYIIRTATLCPECSTAREERLARWEVKAIKDSLERSTQRDLDNSERWRDGRLRDRVVLQGRKPRPLHLGKMAFLGPRVNVVVAGKSAVGTDAISIGRSVTNADVIKADKRYEVLYGEEAMTAATRPKSPSTVPNVEKYLEDLKGMMRGPLVMDAVNVMPPPLPPPSPMQRSQSHWSYSMGVKQEEEAETVKLDSE